MTAPALIDHRNNSEAYELPLQVESDEDAGNSNVVFSSFFNEKTSIPHKQFDVTGERFGKLFEKPKFRPEKSGLGYVPAKLNGDGRRANKNVEYVSLAVIDSDGGVPLAEILARVKGYIGIVHTTYSFSVERPKYRGILRLKKPVKREDWAAYWEGFVEHFGADIIDPQCKDPARFYFFPACPEENAHLYQVLYLEGELLDPAPLIARGREILKQRTPPTTINRDLESGVSWLMPETPENIERVKGMLAVLDAACDYGTWRNIGWALASLGWKCGFELFDDWSKTAPDRYDPAAVTNVWDSYREDRGIRFGTLVYLAKEAGCEDPRISSTDVGVAKVNERYAVILSEASIYDTQQDRFIPRASFLLIHANIKINTGTVEKPAHVDLGNHWIRHKDRRQHTELTLAPGQPQITASNQLNVWAGFSVPSIQGDISLFLELAEQLIPDASDRKYVMTWLSRLIQNPAEKFHVALVVWSSMQGTGKNLFFESVGRIIHDRHSGVIGQEAFTDQFTEWHSHKVLLIADEVSATGDRKTADRIKVLLTATKNSINVKNAPKYEEPNLTKWVILSNHPDAVHLRDSDRRYYVVEASRKRLSTEFAERYVHWRDNGGLSAIRHYLENYDTSGFNPKAPAPMNRAKTEMIEDNRSDLERWLNTILTATDIAALIGREICTADELASKYKNASGNTTSSKTISNVLTSAGLQRLSKQARCKNGKRPRVYALCNIDRWESKTEIELGAEMDKPFMLFGG